MRRTASRLTPASFMPVSFMAARLRRILGIGGPGHASGSGPEAPASA